MNFFSIESVETRINSNYACLKELEQLVPLQDTDDEKLEIISLIGKMYAEYVTGIYSSNTIEQQVIKIGKKLKFFPIERPENRQILIVMSEAGEVGGHTVLVHNWIKWDNENQYSIIFTNDTGFCVPEFIEDAVQESGGTISFLSGSYTEKAIKLLEASQMSQRVILFTHMEDIVPILAYSNESWKIPVYFYNHADYKFSYGFSVSDVVLNLYEFDVDKSIRYRGVPIRKSIHLQFPGEGKIESNKEKIEKNVLRKKIEQKYGVKEKEKLIVSMGEDFKYESAIGYEFDTFVNEVLYQSDMESSFLIIGADKEKEKWIQLEQKTHGKGRALGILPRSEAEELISAADIYIVSFPMASSGNSTAEQASVPYLYLNIFNRGVEKNDIRMSTSIGELVEKTLDILNGNGEKYLPRQNMNIWTKEKWKRKWKEIYDSVTSHKLDSFYPQRHIETQEYVNCQLMQEKAAQNVYIYLKKHGYKLNEQMKKEISRLERKYNMGIIYNHVLYLEKKYDSLSEIADSRLYFSNKHLQLYLTAIKWIGLKQKGKRIDEYLYKQGYRTVAVYGMGYMGKCLAEELEGDFMKVLYGVDRNGENLESEITIFKPTDVVERADVIINTTTIDNRDITKSMNIKKINMIRLDELFEKMEMDSNDKISTK